MKLNKKTIRELERVIETIEMGNCEFGGMNPNANERMPKCERDVTAFIRERTDLWRRTWIISPLREIVREAKAQK